MTRIAFVLLTVCVAVPVVAADGVGDVAAGTRVQLYYRETPDGEVVTAKGELRAADPDSVTLVDGHSNPLVVSISKLTRVDVYRGRHRHALAGAVAGGALALVAGGLYLAAECSGETVCANTGPGIAKVTAVWGGLGALVGYLVRGDSWETIVDDRPRVGLVPVYNTRAIGVVAVVSWK